MEFNEVMNLLVSFSHHFPEDLSETRRREDFAGGISQMGALRGNTVSLPQDKARISFEHKAGQRGREKEKNLGTCRLSTSKDVMTNDRRPYVHILAVLAMHCTRERDADRIKSW